MPVEIEGGRIEGGYIIRFLQPVSYSDYAIAIARLEEELQTAECRAVLVDASATAKPQSASMARSIWDDVFAAFGTLPFGYVVPRDFDEDRKAAIAGIEALWDGKLSFFQTLDEGLAWLEEECRGAAG